MPQLETTCTPLNGVEIKKLTREHVMKFVDNIPLLKEGNAFKQVHIELGFYMTAFPADCPVPTSEYGALLGLQEGQDADFEADKVKLEDLEKKKKILQESIDKIDKFIDKFKKKVMMEDTIRDTGIPDEVRIAHGLPIPMLKTMDNGKRVEVYVDSKDIIRV